MNHVIQLTSASQKPAAPLIFTRKLMAAAMVACALAGCSPKAKIGNILEGAKKLRDAGDYDKAKTEYIKVLRVDSKNAVAMRELGLIWYEEGAALKAFPFLNRTLELQPGDTEIRMKRALIYREFGDRVLARKEAGEVLKQAPGNDEALLLFTDASATKEELDDAEQELKKHAQSDRPGVHLSTASLFSHKGEVASAEKEVLQALALDPKSIPALLAKANFCLARKDLDGAGEALKTASALSPLRSIARMKFAGFKALTGAKAEAEALLTETTDKAPDFVPAWKARAEMALAAKKPQDALSLLEKVFAVDPANFDGRMLEAQIVMDQKDYKKAITLLQSLRTAYPKIPTVMYQLARAHLYDGNPQQTQTVLNDAVAAKPGYVDAVLLLGEVKLKLGDAVGNVALMQDLLKAHAGLMPAQLQLAESFTALGRYDEAAALYVEQIKVNPATSGAYVLLGSVLSQQGKTSEARAALTKAMELSPENLLTVYQLVELDLQDKDFKAAHQRVEAQLQKKDSGTALFLEGSIFAAEHDWAHAEETLLKALKVTPDSSSARHELAKVYVGSGDLTKALATLEELLAKQPDDIGAAFTSAEISEKQNDLPKARAGYEKLLAQKPNFVPAMNNLACLYADAKELDKAYDLAGKAKALHADDPTLADTLGWIVYQRGDYQQALGLLAESAGKLPNNLEIQYHLGMAAYMMGQADVAQKALQLAVASPEPFKGKEQIQVKLDTLGKGRERESSKSAADLETAVQKQSGDPVLWTQLALVYEQQGSAEKAAHAYEVALKINPKLAVDTIKLAQLEAGPLKNPGKAAELAGKARELLPNDPRVAGLLGTLAYQSGNYAKAYDLLRESARSVPNDAALLHDFAWASYSQGKVEEARESMQHVLTAAPASPQAKDATTFLALTALDQGGKDFADQATKMENLFKDSDDVPALMVRAALHVQHNQSKQAVDLYTKVLHRFPDFSPAQKWLAALFSGDSSTLQQGYDLAVKARKTLPDDSELAKILARLAYQRNEFSYAAQLFEESARKRPLDAKDLCYFGKSLVADGHGVEGTAALQKALAAGLQEPLASDVKGTLAKLEKK